MSITSCKYGETYYMSSINYNGAVWKLEITPLKHADGVTKINWKMRTAGGASGASYTSGCWVQLHVPHDGSQTSRFFDTTITSSFEGRTIGSGEFLINHEPEGETTFSLKIVSNFEGQGHLTSFRDFQLPSNPSQTNCLPPTNIMTSLWINDEETHPYYYKPGSKMTILWSGAAAGSSNPIIGYVVKYKIGGGQWQEITHNGVSAQTVLTIPSNAERGAEIWVSIKTVGQVGDSEEYSQIVAQVNRLPKSPKTNVTEEITIMPSNSTFSQQLNVIRLTDELDNQTHTLQWSQDDQTWESVSGLSWKTIVTEPTTYYFRVSDGLENSDKVTRQFIKNTKPSLTVSIQGQALGSDNNTSKINYCIAPEITAINEENGQSGNNRYIYKLYASTEKDSGYVLIKTIEQVSNVLQIKDVRSLHAPTINNGYFYKFGVIRNDSVENSDEQLTDPFYITKIPSIRIENDKTGTKDSWSTGTLSFSNYLTAKIVDDGYTKIVCQYSDGVREATGLTSRQARLAPTRVARGDTRELKIILEGSDFITSTLETIKVTRIRTATLTNIQTQSGDLNPYTDTSAQWSLNNPFFNGELNSYGLSSGEQTINIKAEYGSKSREVGFKIKQFSGNSLFLNLDQGHISSLFNELGIDTNKNVPTSVNITLSLTNLYGDVFSGKSSQNICYVNDRTNPILRDITYSVSSPLAEGATFQIDTLNLTQAYHRIVKILVTGLNGAINETYVTDWGGANNGEVQIDSLSSISIGKITTNISSPEVTITVINAAGQSAATTKAFSGLAYGLTNGSLTISESSWTSDNKIKIGINLNSLGYSYSNGQFKAYVQKKGETGFSDFTDLYINSTTESKGCLVEQQVLSSPQAFLREYDLNNAEEYTKDFLILRIKCTSYVGEASQDWYSQEFTIYKASPTLSYRKNKVGINYNFSAPEVLTDPSFVVGSHEGAKYIYFYNPNNILTIDMETGSIDSSILDCGSWSGIQGGIVSSVNIDIADLSQRNPQNPVIIIAGGSAPIETSEEI